MLSSKRNVISSITFTLLIAACVAKDLRSVELTSEQIMELRNKFVAETIKEKCIATAGEEEGTKLFNTYKYSVEDLKQCLNDALDIAELQADIKTSMKDKTYNAIFHKYCQKRSAAVACAETFYGKIIDCYDKDEKEVPQMAKRLLEALINFACENDGENILTFIADNGPQCFKRKSFELLECAKTNFADLIENAEENKVMSTYVVTEKDCNNFKNFKTCTMDELEKCEEKSAVNFVETLLRHLKKEINFCSKYEKQ